MFDFLADTYDLSAAYRTDFTCLRQEFASLASLVQHMAVDAINACNDGNLALAARVGELAKNIHAMDARMESLLTRLTERQVPEGAALSIVLAMSHASAALVGVAAEAVLLSRLTETSAPGAGLCYGELRYVGAEVEVLLSDAAECFLRGDAVGAFIGLQAAGDLNAFYRRTCQELQWRVDSEPGLCEQALRTLRALGHMHRMASLAQQIAEQVMLTVQGGQGVEDWLRTAGVAATVKLSLH